jgi:hypothetical protein
MVLHDTVNHRQTEPGPLPRLLGGIEGLEYMLYFLLVDAATGILDGQPDIEREGKAKKAYRQYVMEGIALGRRPELVGGGLVRSLGGWSEVLSMRRDGKRLLKASIQRNFEWVVVAVVSHRSGCR